MTSPASQDHVVQIDPGAADRSSADGSRGSTPAEGLWHQCSFAIQLTALGESDGSQRDVPYHERLAMDGVLHAAESPLLTYARYIGYSSYGTSDPVFVQDVYDGLERPMERIDTASNEGFLRLQKMLSGPGAGENHIRLVLVPDLSPVMIEILGSSLDIDPNVFAKHIWSTPSGPFFHEVDQSALLYSQHAETPNTVTLDCPAAFTARVRSNMPLYDVEYLAAKYSEDNFLRPDILSLSPFIYQRRYLKADPGSSDVFEFQLKSRLTLHCKRVRGDYRLVLVLLTPSRQPTYHGIIRTETPKMTVWDEGDPFLMPIDYSTKPIAPDESEKERTPADTLSTALPRLEDTSHDLAQIAKNGYEDEDALFATMWTYVCRKYLNALSRHLERDTRILKSYGILQRRNRNSPIYSFEQDSRTYLAYLEAFEDRILERIHTLEQLKAQLASRQGPQSNHKTLDDIDELIRKLNTFHDHWTREKTRHTDNQQQQVMFTQLLESRRALEQNQLVRKLTLLAFFFVPISAVTSAFGMNLAEVQAHPPSLRTCLIILCTVTAALLVLAGAGVVRNITIGIVRRFHIRPHAANPWYVVRWLFRMGQYAVFPFVAFGALVVDLHAIGRRQRVERARTEADAMDTFFGSIGFYDNWADNRDMWDATWSWFDMRHPKPPSRQEMRRKYREEETIFVGDD